MALKDLWIDKVNGEDEVDAKDINMVAHAVMDVENEIDNMGDSSDVTLSDNLPLMNGTASPGVSEEASRADHKHPTDTSRMPSVASFISNISLENTDNILGYGGGAPLKITWAQLLSQIKGNIDIPVKSVNNKTGAVQLNADDVGARANTWTPTYSDVGADKNGAAASAVKEHNNAEGTHTDIRHLIDVLTLRLEALANSDDTTLDQMSEIVAYIKANRGLIDSVTTSKINVSAIADNLISNVADMVLSAAQGVILKDGIDRLSKDKLDEAVFNLKIAKYALASQIPTKLSELSEDTANRRVSDAEKSAWNAKSNFSGNYADLSNKPTIPTKPSDIGAAPADKTITISGVDESGTIHTWTVYGV